MNSGTCATCARTAQSDLAASRHATDMFERRYFSHVSPGGSDLADRARRAGFAKRRCSWMVGEVLAWGVATQKTAAGTVQAWMDSPSHRRILISRRYGQIGIGLQAGTPYDAYPTGLTAAAVLGRRHCSQRPPHDARVEPERPRARVALVELELLGDREPAARAARAAPGR